MPSTTQQIKQIRKIPGSIHNERQCSSKWGLLRHSRIWLENINTAPLVSKYGTNNAIAYVSNVMCNP
jgi:hypothetical protein